MTLTRALTTSSVFALMAGPALADLTAEQVLADQLSQMSMYGLTVQTTGQSRSGNTLTVEGLSASADIPNEDASMAFTMGGASFTEQGDGSVLVTYPASIPVDVKVSGPGGEDFAVSMVIQQSGMQNIVTGSPEQLRYEFTGQSMSISDLSFTAPDESGDVDMNIDMQMSGLQGVMNIAAGVVRPYDLDLTMDTMKVVADIKEPGGDGAFNVDINVADVTVAYAGQLAMQSLMDSFAETIKKGTRTSGSASFGAANYTFGGNTPDGTIEGAANVASGGITFAMDENGIDYSGQSSEITTTIGGSAIPLPPMTFKLAGYDQRFKLPVVPGENSQGFALRIAMQGLEVDPILWSMIDPGNQLPRDPATVIIDTDGEVILTDDVFAPDYAEKAMMGPPGQINAANINEVRVSLAGAELTGDGAFTFNNQFGIPMPIGTVNMMLTGGNTLMDTLVGMGLLPQEQAMGARMMMGMFARPGDGPDTLVSTIEMKEDGSILANGQRIK